MAEETRQPAALDALRASDAAERNPVRVAYLEALARRAAAQPEAIRQRLNAKLDAAVRELAACPDNAPTEASNTAPSSPLADLLAYIAQHTHGQPEATHAANPVSQRNPSAAPAIGTRQTPELKSVARFHETWSRLSAEQQLTQTLAQAPENAGPMNSQHLVLRSLQTLRTIAPDYLQSFMSYIDTLICLESAARPSASERATLRKPQGPT